MRAAVQVKKAAARANHANGPAVGRAGRRRSSRPPTRSSGWQPTLTLTRDAPDRRTLIDNFRVDPFQAGAGVSHNMNTNEVLANRAIEILGARGVGSGRRGDYAVVNPNDHVNMAQSTNDTFPTAMRIATLDRVERAAAGRSTSSRTRSPSAAAAFDGVLKSGRTHMQDAVPIRLGPGVRGLRADRAPRARARSLAAAEGCSSRTSARPRSAPASTPSPSTSGWWSSYLSEQTGYQLRTGRAPGPRHPVDGADARRLGRAARPGRRPGQDPRGPAADVVAGRAPASPRSSCRRSQPGLVDHAGQGEPGDGREPVDDLLPRHRRRHGRRLGGVARPARAQRDDAAHRARGARVAARS